MRGGYRSNDSLERTFVFIEVGEETFDAWDSYTVASDLLEGPANFQMRAPALPRDDEGRGNQQFDLDARGLRRGEQVKVYVKTPKAERPVLQFVGRLDEVDITESRDGAEVSVTGRDKIAEIYDGDMLPAIGIEDITFDELVRKALTQSFPGQPKPFYAKEDVLISNDANRIILTGKPALTANLSAKAQKKLEQLKVDQAKPHPGETVYAYLARHAQRFGLLIWGTANGKIVFSRPNYDQKPACNLIMRQGELGVSNNVLMFQQRKSFKRRPSEVHVYGYSHGGDHMRSPIHAIVYDDEVRDAGYWRALTIHDNNARTKEEAEFKARFEMSQRRQTGDAIRAIVSGHSDEDGAVYAVDTIASVAWDKAAIFDDRYVISRTFTRSRSEGTRTELHLVPKDSIALGTGEGS